MRPETANPGKVKGVKESAMNGYAEAQNWPHGVRACLNIGCLAKQGAIAGIIAGISFAMFEMMAAWLMKGDFFGPLRMIGAMMLGEKALSPPYSLMTAGMVGMAIHMMLSLIYGVMFGALITYIPSLAFSPARLIGSAAVFGVVLWLVNFYLFAPLFGWNWFPQGTNPLVQGFIGHTVFFGVVLGWYVKHRQSA